MQIKYTSWKEAWIDGPDDCAGIIAKHINHWKKDIFYGYPYLATSFFFLIYDAPILEEREEKKKEHQYMQQPRMVTSGKGLFSVSP